MGKRGPQPLSAARLRLRGSWRAPERASTELAVAAAVELRAPAWLKAAGRKEWKRILPLVQRVGNVAEQDLAVLVSYCRAWQDFQSACAAVDLYDSTADVDLKIKLLGGAAADHPRVRVRDAEARLLRAADRFGFTPAARARLNVVKHGDEAATAPQAKSRFFPSGPATKAG